MTIDNNRIVKPSSIINGKLRVPGDKSISHRVAILSALASGVSKIKGFLFSEDCLNTLNAVELLGASVTREGELIKITGTGGHLKPSCSSIYMGNSGTGMRLLTGLLAGQKFTSELTGDRSLSSRPMGRIKKPLELMGAKIDLTGDNESAPIRIVGGYLRGIEYKLPVASAQVKSCILLAGLTAEGKTVVVESVPTRDHTERILSAMGIPVKVDGLSIEIDGSDGRALQINPMDFHIPGDFSSAAFWITAASCMEGAEVMIENVGLNSGRTAFIQVLRRMGASIDIIGNGLKSDDLNEWEPRGSLLIKGAKLKGVDVGGKEIPNLIDELPLVAVAGALADGKTLIYDATELRVKESDRISSIAEGLSAFGVKLEERVDGLLINGSFIIRGGQDINSYGDHRVAMAMAILSLFADIPTRIMNVACVSTSYPDFWDDMASLCTD